MFVFSKKLRLYKDEICPELGEITFVDGEVRCSVHSHGKMDEEEVDEGVPFL